MLLTRTNFNLYQSAKELIKDIAVLELEVMYLEQHLLSLYRQAFMQQIPNLSLRAPHACLNPLLTIAQSSSDASSITKQTKYVQSNRMTLPRKSDTGPINEPTIAVSKRPQEKPQGLGRSHSSLLHRSVGSARVSPAEKSLRALKPCYTSPLTFQEVWYYYLITFYSKYLLVDYPLI
jgi:Leucine-zipper of ternary complex factor MIP1